MSTTRPIAEEKSSKKPKVSEEKNPFNSKALAEKWVDDYTAAHLNETKKSLTLEEKSKLKKIIEDFGQDAWIFEDSTHVPSYLLLGSYVKSSSFGGGKKTFIQDENGSEKEILKVNVFRNRKYNAVRKFLHNGEKVPLSLLEKALIKEGNNEFIKTPHGNIPIITSNHYRNLKYKYLNQGKKIPEPKSNAQLFQSSVSQPINYLSTFDYLPFVHSPFFLHPASFTYLPFFTYPPFLTQPHSFAYPPAPVVYPASVNLPVPPPEQLENRYGSYEEYKLELSQNNQPFVSDNLPLPLVEVEPLENKTSENFCEKDYENTASLFSSSSFFSHPSTELSSQIESQTVNNAEANSLENDPTDFSSTFSPAEKALVDSFLNFQPNENPSPDNENNEGVVKSLVK